MAAINVRSIDHVTFVVKNLAATRNFYVEILGMREVERPRFSFAGQWFQAGATLIHTILEAEGTGQAGIAVNRNTRGHHLAFVVDDAAKAAEQLVSLGVPLVSPVKLRPDGAAQTFLQDPDGHLVELCSL